MIAWLGNNRHVRQMSRVPSGSEPAWACVAGGWGHPRQAQLLLLLLAAAAMQEACGLHHF